MYDDRLIFEELHKIEETLLHVLGRTEKITSVDDFLSTPWGIDMLDVACIRLEALGEEVKNLDKHSKGLLLSKYPSIPWKKIMGMRDVIAHHYFEIDPDVVFAIVKTAIPPLLEVIRQIKTDFKKDLSQ
ncbi:MAG: DUF86 domain-containing protein [Bacteroidales bacterium]|jgi:uncharacterized protein with HEPN domain|nr:DUF86 domain-containing protein [Bacteroidales bacterium]